MNFEKYIKKYGNYFDYCILSRAHIAPKYIKLVKNYAKHCKIIFDGIDLSFLRESREAKLKNDSELDKKAMYTKQKELEIINNSDITIVKTKEEVNFISQENLITTTAIIPTIEIPPKDFTSYDSRKDILFLGGFHHPPNIDSLEYTINEVFPKIKEKLPDVKLIIIGSNPPKKIIDLCSKRNDVIFLGHVKNLNKYLKECRILLAPLRFGAGMKGKITQSMMFGLVVVTTPIGAEGISTDKENLLVVADTADDLASKVHDVYTDEKLWKEISINANKHAKKHFSPEVVKAIFENIFKN